MEGNELAERPGHCLNCGSVLVGEYCSRCGQRHTGRELRFGELLAELVSELFTWDSRIWRTLLPLLFRPGFLTAEFIAGRRARYVPPLRLYFIISFILFLLISLSNLPTATSPGENAPVAISSSGPVSVVVDPGGRSGAGATPTPGETAEEGGTLSIDLAGEDSPQWLKRLEQQLEKNASRLEADPGAFVDTLVEYLPHMMFLLLPVFALLLKLCYLFAPFHYLQHLVFSLHYNSFLYLLYLVAVGFERLGLHSDALLLLILAVYLPVGLWRVYGSRPLGAVGRAVLVNIVYGILLALGFASLAVLALLVA
jgi:hypothetical protein